MINVLNGTKVGFDLEEYIYIGRSYKKSLKSSPLANPFSVKEFGRAKAIELYKQWLYSKYSSGKGPEYNELQRLVNIYKETGRLYLVCWCSPKPCHGEVIKTFIKFILEEDNVSNSRHDNL